MNGFFIVKSFRLSLKSFRSSTRHLGCMKQEGIQNVGMTLSIQEYRDEDEYTWDEGVYTWDDTVCI